MLGAGDEACAPASTSGGEIVEDLLWSSPRVMGDYIRQIWMIPQPPPWWPKEKWRPAGLWEAGCVEGSLEQGGVEGPSRAQNEGSSFSMSGVLDAHRHTVPVPQIPPEKKTKNKYTHLS